MLGFSRSSKAGDEVESVWREPVRPAVSRRAWAFLTASAMAVIASAILNPPHFLLAPPARTAEAAREWVEIVKPIQMFAMPTPRFGAEPTEFTARRHNPGGGRIDALTFGAQAPGAGQWLHVEIHRVWAEDAPSVPFYADMARQAARSGHSLPRAGLPRLMRTRFGKAEIGELQLRRGDRFTACLGFRIANRQPELAIAGIACGTPDLPVTPQALACAIDRLDLLSAGEDTALGNYFARSELTRGRGCPAQRSAKKPHKPQWLTASATPELKHPDRGPPLRRSLDN